LGLRNENEELKLWHRAKERRIWKREMGIQSFFTKSQWHEKENHIAVQMNNGEYILPGLFLVFIRLYC
jgi:hypothetical protein